MQVVRCVNADVATEVQNDYQLVSYVDLQIFQMMAKNILFFRDLGIESIGTEKE